VSVTTQLALQGIARDPSGYAAAGGGALRRAEGCVIRAEGVAESRPNFQIVRNQSTTRRIVSLHETPEGSVLSIERDANTGAYTASVDAVDVGEPASVADDPWAPPSYEDAESSFASARGNLYVSGKRGTVALVDGRARFAGLDIRHVTDYRSPGGTAALVPYRTLSYRFVFVSKDANGYERRSPPSARRVLTLSSAPELFGTGTRFYFPPFMREGDQVEFYRSRAIQQLSPRPEHFFAFAYTLTSSDVLAGYFVPPTDTVQEAQLGAELYTDESQGGALAAKYRPPAARALAWWASCMWYGATTAARRLTVTIGTLYRAGIAIFSSNSNGVPARIWQFTSGSVTVTVTDTTGLEQGMIVTDNYELGPTFAGTYVPANTYIVGISGTTVSLNNAATATGNQNVIVLPTTPPRGLQADVSSGTFTGGSPIVTGIPSTTSWVPGMYVTTNSPTTGGPANPSFVPGGTKILTVDGPNQVTLDHNATGTGAGTTMYVGDVVTINGVDFYACRGRSPTTKPWDSSIDPPRGFRIGDPSGYTGLGVWNIGLAVQNLCVAINWHNLQNASFNVSATPLGDTWDVLDVRDAGGLFAYPGTLPSSFTLEEGSRLGDSFSSTSITLTSTCPSAFASQLPLAAEDTVVPNRLYFSQPDEPEAVPLANSIDIGRRECPIQALVPLRDALLVFKTDGLWRVTGSAPDAWALDLLDTTLRLIRPECVAVANGIAYAWCDRGFFAITDGDTRSISAGRLDVELARVARSMLEDGGHGAFVRAWRRRNLVLFGVPGAANASKTAKVFAYSLTTQAITEWSVEWACACESEAHDAVYYSRPADSLVDYEIRRATAGDPQGHDHRYGLTGSISMNAARTIVTVTKAGCASWQPRSGDFLEALPPAAPPQARRITDVQVSGSNYLLTVELAYTAAVDSEAGWAAYEAVPIVLEWHPTAPARLPVGALCRELQAHVDLRDYSGAHDIPPSYELGATPDFSTGPTTIVSRKTRVAQVQPIRAGLARSVARAASLAPILITSDMFALRVLGLSLVYATTSEKVTR